MKRALLSIAVALVLLAISASAQSLGDVARRQKTSNRPKAAKVWTNDDMPSVPQSEPATAPADADKKTDEAKSDSDKDAAKPAAPAGDKDSAAKAMTAQIASQKEEISRLGRELDIAQREFKLQVANYYADAGNSLRDPKAWQDQSKKTQDEIAAKQAALDKAKQKLADMQEAARKAGFPSSVYE